MVMKYAALVQRIAGDGADAWLTHHEARQARERGEDVILLSVGDPDRDTPPQVIERAIECLHAGDTHYTVAAGRHGLRAAIADLHRRRTGQAVECRERAVSIGRAKRAVHGLDVSRGPGDEVLALEPLYPTYPATIEVSGARLVRVPAAKRQRLSARHAGAGGC
jgi:arginine:pyruvate transaminase